MTILALRNFHSFLFNSIFTQNKMRNHKFVTINAKKFFSHLFCFIILIWNHSFDNFLINNDFINKFTHYLYEFFVENFFNLIIKNSNGRWLQRRFWLHWLGYNIRISWFYFYFWRTFRFYLDLFNRGIFFYRFRYFF